MVNPLRLDQVAAKIDGGDVLQAVAYAAGGHYEEVIANARLIAAAPELLAALEEIVRNDPFRQSSAGVIARAAVAKVTGAT